VSGPSGRGAALRPFLRALFLLVWLLLLLTPCMAFLLASQGELRLRTGPAPEQELRLWLVQEARRAGLGLARASEHLREGERCFQTEVRFLLWRGRQLDGETRTSYCACYRLEDTEFRAPRAWAGACAGGETRGDG